MSRLALPPRDYLLRILRYDADSGLMYWNRREDCPNAWNGKHEGKVAGAVWKDEKKGYRAIRISINKEIYSAHRLAWLMVTGDQPPEEIDHKDGDAVNNRWSNLRDGTLINARNKSMLSNNTSGYTGVSWHKQRQKWCVRIKVGDRYQSFGLYSDKDEAAAIATKVRAASGYDGRHGSDYSPMRLEQMA